MPAWIQCMYDTYIYIYIYTQMGKWVPGLPDWWMDGLSWIFVGSRDHVVLLLRDAGVVIEYWEMCDYAAPRDREAWMFFWAVIHYHADLLIFQVVGTQDSPEAF